MTRKLLIVPYFGEAPPWFDKWLTSVGSLQRYGYDLLLDQDEDEFRRRVKRVLGITAPPMAGTSNSGDFRPAFGDLYAPEIRGYDFWGYTDVDCIYGRVGLWLTERFLHGLDVHTNGTDCLCGPWTIYRNRTFINQLYQRIPGWRELMEAPVALGSDEVAFTPVVYEADRDHELALRSTFWHTEELNHHDALHYDGDRLMEGRREVFYAHLKRTKKWPAGCMDVPA